MPQRSEKGHIAVAFRSKPESAARKETYKCKVRHVAETGKSEEEKTDSARAPDLKQPTNEDNWTVLLYKCDCASPIVQVNKHNGSVKICGDFKAKVNLFLNPKEYPMPMAEEIFVNLQGGQKFFQLDLNGAYLRIQPDDESKELATINTPLGLYRYKRLPFGISESCAIFQVVIVEQIRFYTKKDAILAKVYDYVRNGWPSTLSDREKELKPFFRCRLELTTESVCFLWNERVIIHPVFQNYVINELHQGHPGMVMMKSLARMHVWWPNIDDDIEKKMMMRVRELECLPQTGLSVLLLRRAVVTRGAQGTERLKFVEAEVAKQLSA
ncbi:hypothetical protein QYM36_008455 [Artemia franciscana]|uniref:RNA-directed DNA polymerase n=1 Tax=Artemia franciscana TaxID=6661 RepID=A0AA88IGR1_ARTSF|nr:hypothetical protein QYM36_008455 [Artemia franciscana]